MDTNEKLFDLLKDKSMRDVAERLVFDCGVHAHLKGFDCLADATILYASTNASVGEIYGIVGTYRNIKPKTVMRLITYAIDDAPDFAALLSRLTESHVTKAELHNGLAIADLGYVCRKRRRHKDKSDR